MIAGVLRAVVGLSVLNAHPLHTTMTTLTYDDATHQATAWVRVFASDLSAAVARRAGVAVPADDRVSDSASVAYLRSALELRDGAGRVVPLAWCGSRRTNDLLWLCVRAELPQGLHDARVVNRALWELFDDQINIVSVDDGGRRESLLFTKGDHPKPVP